MKSWGCQPVSARRAITPPPPNACDDEAGHEQCHREPETDDFASGGRQRSARDLPRGCRITGVRLGLWGLSGRWGLWGRSEPRRR